MVKILGLGTSKKRGKKRLSPSARTRQGMSEQHPMYQYAMKEYAETAVFGSQNDDGKFSEEDNARFTEEELEREREAHFETISNAGSSASQSVRSNVPLGENPPVPHATSSTLSTDDASLPQAHPPSSAIHSTRATAAYSSSSRHYAIRSPFEAEMPDATYEEYYGDAYTGSSLKYLYPSGYQSMRPRSCPWKLSIIVCLLFTWLSVFIVGHCSDQVDYDRNDYEIDDDTLVIDIRWCGSRPLYLMWVTSMLITGLAAAYCSVIGYIKVRDFAVANARSQPPGVMDTRKSDFYVRVEDGGMIQRTGSSGSSVYRPSIYQSDGRPQFWGSYIYTPTQAAVAITSR